MLKRYVGWKIISGVPAGGRYSQQAPVGYDAWRAALDSCEQRLLDVSCHGKLSWWQFGALGAPAEQTWTLLCSYGMSGGWSNVVPFEHPAFKFKLESPWSDEVVTLAFEDQRHFGTIKFVRGTCELERRVRALGPDVLSGTIVPELLIERLFKRPRATLAEALMDQSVVAGIGNYLKAEILWHARLSPHRTVVSLTAEDVEALWEAITVIPDKMYRLHGTTLATYADPDGETGVGRTVLCCYGRCTDAAGSIVIRETTKDKRTTWWCPDRQH